MVITILIIIIMILSFLLIYTYINVSQITNQMKYKKKTSSQIEVTISNIQNPSVKHLCNEVNDLFSELSQIKKQSTRKEKEIKEMLSNISHDIRTPLTSIQGYLELLDSSTEDAEREKYIKIIEYRLNIFKSLLEDLFLYSKLNLDEYVVEVKPIEVFELLCQTVASFYEEFVEKEIEPKVDFANTHIEYMVNEEALIRVFQNLINNALQHGIGELLISQERNKIIFRNLIQEEVDVDRLFERFYKKDDSRHANSTGLGLSIVQQLMEKMGGSVSARKEGMYLEIILVFN